MKKVQIELYKFSELGPTAKAKVLRDFGDINVLENWWEDVYEDASMVGINIQGFCLDRNFYLTADVADSEHTKKLILVNHGSGCDTYKIAEAFDAGELTYPEFCRQLKKAYLTMLEKEYDYLASEEAIIDTLDSNEFLFLKNGIHFSGEYNDISEITGCGECTQCR